MEETELQAACEEFLAEWPHFLSCIDFNHSNLDARAIKFFNEVPGKIETAVKKLRKELSQ